MIPVSALELGSEGALLWAHLMLLWSLVNYGAGSDPSSMIEVAALRESGTLRRWKRRVWTRALVLGVAAALLPGLSLDFGGVRIVLAGLLVACGGALPLVRARLAESRVAVGRYPISIADLRTQRGVWIAEWEAAVNLCVAGACAWLIQQSRMTISPLIQLPLTQSRLACLLLVVAIAVALGRGGAFIVRGFLNKAAALPLLNGTDRERVDVLEYNRGRLIGILERLILLLLVVAKAYGAIGFLIAAKGLIRSKELEHREFAEYFLIGTLASTLAALLGGIAVQLMLSTYW